MSLRLRLLVGLAALVAAGLAASSVVTFLSVDHFLVGRLDGQLTDTARVLTNTGAAYALGGDGHNHPSPASPSPYGHGLDNLPPDQQRAQDELNVRNAAGPELFVEFIASTGALVEQITATAAPRAVAPRLPATVLTAITSSLQTGVNATGPSTTGPPEPAGVAVRTFQAPPAAGPGAAEEVAVALPAGGGAIIVAASRQPITSTLHRLLAVEALVGLAVLALTLGLGLALARQATRPLEDIALTADAIAGGDLSRRVPAADARSEAGRVALALNAMMGRIQEAFARRDATEARLRAFVADASHELATPLTSIRGYAELFRRGLADRPEDLAKALGRIEKEAARMGVLVDDLLTLASLDAGRPFAQDPVDLRAIAADAVADLQVVDPERPVRLEASQPVIVVGDEARLRQVAANLVSNARRHTPPGTPVTVRARVEGSAGMLEVVDQGPGMAPADAQKVFDRFFRVDKARSRAMGGAGLGLSIVASIAEAHRGRASLTTALGQGSTFTVSVPLARPPEDAA